MTAEESIKNAIPLLRSLIGLLRAHGGANFICGINLVVSNLEDERFSAEERFAMCARLYCGQMKGAGSLADFVVWDQNSVVRDAANAKLDAIFRDLWNIFSC